MSTSTRLPPEGNRQADRNNNLILVNTRKLGYHDLLLVELLEAGTDGIDSVDVTRQDGPRFWTDRLSFDISCLKRRNISIDGYMRKLTLPDGQYTRRKCYYLKDKNAALQAINYLDDAHQANHRCPLFNADQKAVILRRFRKA